VKIPKEYASRQGGHSSFPVWLGLVSQFFEEIQFLKNRNRLVPKKIRNRVFRFGFGSNRIFLAEAKITRKTHILKQI